MNAFRSAQVAKKQTPLFDQFARNLADGLSKMLESDSAATRLAEMVKALPDVTLDDDRQAVARIDFELGALAERIGIWRKRITPIDKKLTHLRVASTEPNHD